MHTKRENSLLIGMILEALLENGQWAVPSLDEARTYMYIGDSHVDKSIGEMDLGGNILIRELLDASGTRTFECHME